MARKLCVASELLEQIKGLKNYTHCSPLSNRYLTSVYLTSVLRAWLHTVSWLVPSRMLPCAATATVHLAVYT